MCVHTQAVLKHQHLVRVGGTRRAISFNQTLWGGGGVMCSLSTFLLEQIEFRSLSSMDRKIMIQLKNLNYIIAVLQKSHNFVINNLFTLITIHDFISKFAEFFLPGIGNSVVPAQSRILQ